MNEKKAVLSGTFWKFSERIIAQLVTLVVSIVLARLLLPSEYGIISLVNIFITIANVFVVNGFGTALIQKKNADSLDFSSVFYFTLVFTGIVYVILFFCAKPISQFYNMPIIVPVFRVLAISVPIMGFNSIQQAYVSRKMQFKKFFWATLIGTIISAFVGIVMAYKGLGVWALVAQTLTNNTIDTIILQISIDWKITIECSFKRIKSLLNYGWKLLVQSLILQFYSSIRSLLIGKFYTASDLAYYTKGKQFPELICNNCDTAINATLFPVMSKFQDNIEHVKKMMRKATQMVSYIMSPILIGFIVIAKPLITLILTDKWLFSVPYLRICCIILLFRAPQTAILQAIKAVGKSDIVLKYDIPIRIFAIVVLIVSIKFSVFVFAVSEIITTIFGTLLYGIAAKKIFNYTFIEICKDFLTNVALASTMGVLVYAIAKNIALSNIILGIIEIIMGVVFYCLLSIITKSECFKGLLNIIKEFFYGYRKRKEI